MIHLRLFAFFLLFFLLPFQFSNAINCFAGSRGYIKGKQEQKFVNETCDEGMKYCLESYTEDFDSVTASCQTLSTSRRILNICESGKPLISSGLTTRCCYDDLCNNIGIEKKLSGLKNK
ncbi:hypothetical protein CRE_11072 [Caenorhabditis remanei]|uniref:Uncharacterized protein n=1 Tax=Caenorhabditis remanei TaxID=31234 RepID=E3M5E0_CAERE|nr:hypothetical protein CRE_11072 [Caenorhabditis remanei]